jgi:hypothetical protein
VAAAEPRPAVRRTRSDESTVGHRDRHGDGLSHGDLPVPCRRPGPGRRAAAAAAATDSRAAAGGYRAGVTVGPGTVTVEAAGFSRGKEPKGRMIIIVTNAAVR